MMSEASVYYASTAAGMVALAVMSLVALRGWRDWIGFKRFEVEQARHGDTREPGSGNAANRIELADLRERLRKLEAIAAGVDL